MNKYRTPPWGRGALCVTVFMAAMGLGSISARADFKVGVEIPAFSMKTADDTVVEVQRANSALTVQIGDERVQPKALIIHLLQPDCLQCRAQLQALKPLAERFRERGVITLGIAHRGTPEAARELAKDLNLPFPVLMGVDSEIARQFAAGDTLGIMDAQGVVRFAQVGYGEGDAKFWERAVEELLAGKDVTKTGVERERLAVGDRLPAIHLASLRTGKPIALVGEGNQLVFRGDDGKGNRPKAAVGMFSRY
ncbi:MAG: redoxin domain-containing protein [Planctomycetota bacterium]